jgi:hypothetical protein
MKTLHDIEQKQGVGPPAPTSLHSQDTVQEASGPPAQIFPQPPQRPPRPRRNRWVVIGAVVLALALMLSLGVFLIPGLLQRPSSPGTPTATPPAATAPTTPVPTTPGADVTPTPPPGVTPGHHAGPPGISDPAYWDPILGTKPGVNKVESVSFANIMDTPALQALVKVRHTGTDALLDVYVFTNITNAHPKQLFKLAGLVKGDARISGYSTIMTAEVDPNSALNKDKLYARLTPDLFREFDWSDGAGTFVQVAFPGLYPDLTRYQAEQDQRSVNAGQDTWKYNAAQVARNLAIKLLKWSDKAQTIVLSGAGPKDVNAVVQVRSTGPDHPTIKVTLSRLEGNTTNIWEAIAVADGSVMSITSPQKWDILTSPVAVKGTGSAFEGDVGTVYVLDHLYAAIGHAKGVPANNGKTTFTATVPYSASFHGVQEGVLAYYTDSQADGAIAGVVMLKVLIAA